MQHSLNTQERASLPDTEFSCISSGHSVIVSGKDVWLRYSDSMDLRQMPSALRPTASCVRLYGAFIAYLQLSHLKLFKGSGPMWPWAEPSETKSTDQLFTFPSWFSRVFCYSTKELANTLPIHSITFSSGEMT